MEKNLTAIIIVLCLMGCRAEGLFNEITKIDTAHMSETELSQVVSIKLTVKKSVVGSRAIKTIEQVARANRVYPFIGDDEDNIYIRLMGEFRNMHKTLLELERIL